MKKGVLVLALLMVFSLSGCVNLDPGNSAYYYEISGINVHRSSWDFGSPDPKLNVDGMTISKIQGSKQYYLKSPDDSSDPNVRVTLEIEGFRERWNIHLNRGESQELKVEVADLPDKGVASIITEGVDVDWFGREQNTWHVSDTKTKSYTATEQQLSYITLKDDRSFFDKFFNDYSRLLDSDSKTLKGSPDTEWLNNKLAELEQKNNGLSTFLQAYNGSVIAIVVTDYKGVIYKKTYRITGGRLVETSEKPDAIVVLTESHLSKIIHEYRIDKKNGWTAEEITELESLVLDSIDFQGAVIPWERDY